jgi:starvation-inducible DNA-binding protein
MKNIDVGIEDKARGTLAIGLSRLLADTYALALTTHGFHWNVTGPLFPALHALFDGQTRELYAAVDVVAERIRALGHYAPGSFHELAKLSAIAEHEGVPRAPQMVRRLLDAHETAARTARALLDEAESARDHATADLLTARVSAHEKAAWMLRSSVE